MGTESVSVAFSSMNLQIPIPYDGRVKTLPKTATLLKELNSIGIKESEIEKITIGYHIQDDKKRSDLITLVPTYFIKVGRSWNSLAGGRRSRRKTRICNGGGKFQLQQLLVFQLFQPMSRAVKPAQAQVPASARHRPADRKHIPAAAASRRLNQAPAQVPPYQQALPAQRKEKSKWIIAKLNGFF